MQRSCRLHLHGRTSNNEPRCSPEHRLLEIDARRKGRPTGPTAAYEPSIWILLYLSRQLGADSFGSLMQHGPQLSGYPALAWPPLHGHLLIFHFPEAWRVTTSLSSCSSSKPPLRQTIPPDRAPLALRSPSSNHGTAIGNWYPRRQTSLKKNAQV